MSRKDEQNLSSLSRPTVADEIASDPGKMHRLVEAFSSCRLGQMVLMRLLRLLHQLELVVQWSVPDSERSELESGTLNTYIVPIPVQPLPWILMVPVIAGVRTYVMCEQVYRRVLGKPTLKMWHMAVRLQFWQRELRAVRKAGYKELSVREEQVVQGCLTILGDHAVEVEHGASPNPAAATADEQNESAVEGPEPEAEPEGGVHSRHSDSIGDLVTKEYKSEGETSDSSFVTPSDSETDDTLEDSEMSALDSLTDSDVDQRAQNVNAHNNDNKMEPKPDCKHDWCEESYSKYVHRVSKIASEATGLDSTINQLNKKLLNGKASVNQKTDHNSSESQLNQKSTSGPMTTINVTLKNVQITLSSSKAASIDSSANNASTHANESGKCSVDTTETINTPSEVLSATLNSDLEDVEKELQETEEILRSFQEEVADFKKSDDSIATTRELLPGTPDTPKVTLTESQDPTSAESEDEHSSFLRSIENNAIRSSAVEAHEEQLDEQSNADPKISKNKRRRLKKKENKRKQKELSQQELADENGENKEN